MRHVAISLVAIASLAACAPQQADADSMAAANTIDTVKPVVVAAPDTDSVAVGPTSSTGTKTARPTSTTAPARRDTPLVTRDTAHLGRDSVIRINPRDPKRMIPTEKKP